MVCVCKGDVYFFCAVGAEFVHQHRRHLHGLDMLVMFIRSL